jgi:hypothetical protein
MANNASGIQWNGFVVMLAGNGRLVPETFAKTKLQTIGLFLEYALRIGWGPGTWQQWQQRGYTLRPATLTVFEEDQQ